MSSIFRRMLLAALPLAVPAVALALPISFGVNQGDLEYNEAETPDFKIYFDKRVPHEATLLLNSLAVAKPSLERWFGVTRNKQLPVITSAVTQGASFANFITDAIELQTMGQGDRDLAWHELTHSVMFEHYHNIFGPAGSVIHLAWMPAWFIEGMAEAISVSIASDTQASIERYQALSGKWPSYDRMHSLYSSAKFFLQGYATSGGFVAWILRQEAKQGIPELLRSFFRYTLPHYYPLALNPFSRFMPMDETLKDYLDRNGKTLFADYKEAARKYWLANAPQTFFAGLPGERLRLQSLGTLRTVAGVPTLMMGDADGGARAHVLKVDASTGFVTATEPTEFSIPMDVKAHPVLRTPDAVFGVREEGDYHTGLRPTNMILPILCSDSSAAPAESCGTIGLRRNGQITELFAHGDRILWLEEDGENTRLCFAPKAELAAPALDKTISVTCPLAKTMPESLSFLGGTEDELWFGVRNNLITGDRSSILHWDLKNDRIEPFAYTKGGQPRELVVMGSKIWMLVSKRRFRALRRLDRSGLCEAEIELADYPLRLSNLEDGRLLLGLYEGTERTIIAVDPAKLPNKPCLQADEHISPLLIAARTTQPLSLAAAVTQASLWTSGPTSPVDYPDTAVQPTEIRSAQWVPRPVLAIPWIGADDALGYQYGIVSVPLMDHLQNETVRASFLYGPQSRYPNSEVTLTSTRFWPTLDLSAFRRQTWNGNYRISENEAQASYFDEQGGRFAAHYNWYGSRFGVSSSAGIIASHRQRFLGPQRVITGRFNEPFANVAVSTKLPRGNISFGAGTRVAPASMNRDLDYNILSAGTTYSVTTLLASTLSLGISGSRMRGTKLPNLREIYVPLKTFIPGSGGGYNQNSYPLYGTGSLFSYRYGDTQARSSLDWTLPLIADADTYLWIFYVNSLNLTAFYNYGGAWFEGTQTYRSTLIKSHGYQLDLLFENKGVKFNAGLGTGQVVGDSFQVFFKVGFDAFL